MNRGDLVKLRAYGGEETIHRVVAEEGNTVYVPKGEEYQRGGAEAREPTSVGFPANGIIEKIVEVCLNYE